MSDNENFFKKILIIEPNQDLKKAYTLMLGGVKGYNIISTFPAYNEALNSIKKNELDLVIMDLEQPKSYRTEGITRIKQANNKVKILVNTAWNDYETVLNSLASGAMGYIVKTANHHQFIQAVDQALKGKYPLDNNITELLVKSFQRNPNSPLTVRETEVLEGLAQGKTYSGVSRVLKISIATVKTHLNHIYWKLGVKNKSEAISLARSNKYIV